MTEGRHECAKHRREIPVDAKTKRIEVIYNGAAGTALLTFLSQAQARCCKSIHA